jgi:DNA-binding MarR family transcriptional regulator
MANTSLTQHVEELTEVVQHLLRLKSRFKIVLPDNMARMRARMAELHAEGRAGSAADRHLLYSVGIVLWSEPTSMTMGELSKALDVPLSTATRTVNWMVKGGYVVRLPDSEDRRIVRVALTDAGRAMVGMGNEFIRKNVEQVLRRFTAEERESLVFLMSKLVKTLEEES